MPTSRGQGHIVGAVSKYGWEHKMTTHRDNRSTSDVIGVLFGTNRLHGCRALKTMFGGLRYRRAEVDVIDNDLDAALPELLKQLGVGNQTLPIAGAIPTDECYFVTRPIASSAASASPRALLRESLRSALSPPGRGTSSRSGTARPARGSAVLVPLQCEFYALEGLTHLVRTIERVCASFNKDLSLFGVPG